MILPVNEIQKTKKKPILFAAAAFLSLLLTQNLAMDSENNTELEKQICAQHYELRHGLTKSLLWESSKSESFYF